jgi:hypothetical protein
VVGGRARPGTRRRGDVNDFSSSSGGTPARDLFTAINRGYG